MPVPDVEYVRGDDGVYIAYQVVGNGPLDLVYLDSWVTPLEERWEVPVVAESLRRLAGFTRLISFDKRGVGMSDPVPFDIASTLEEWASDVLTVMDAVGSRRAALFGHHDGGWPAMLLAASHPDRASHLCLVNSTARIVRGPDHPWGIPVEFFGTPEERLATYGRSMPSAATVVPPDLEEVCVRWRRHQASPSTFSALMRMQLAVDLGAVLTAIAVPTLVVHNKGDRFWRVGHGRHLAENIPGAKFVETPGRFHYWASSDSEPIVDAVEEFLTGTRSTSDMNRVLATVLFSDIVDSTGQARALGDKSWRQLLDRYEAAVRREITRHGGREVFTKGDEFLVTFDGPARAVRCARAVRERATEHNLQVRSGIHTGEMERRHDDLAGIAVHIGARVMAAASPGEILVSRTVTDLVAGSGLQFDDHGLHNLKGVDRPWQLFALAD